jgi:hypothetical protein
MQKKADAIIKVYNDSAMTPQEWEIVGFHVYNSARQGVLDNVLAFYDGLMYFMHSKHFGNKNEGQLEFDFGGFSNGTS